MEKRVLIVFLVIYILSFVGCQKSSPPMGEIIPPTNLNTPILRLPYANSQYTSTMTPQLSLTASRIPNETATPSTTTTKTSTVTLTYPPETNIHVQCLEVLPGLLDGAISNGVVVLGGGSGDQIRRYNIFLHDMATDEITQISTSNEIQYDHVVSFNKNLIAYLRVTSNEVGMVVQKELIIATASDQIKKEIPWEEKWAYILTWTNDQRLLLAFDDPELESSKNLSTPLAYLLLNPFSDERKILLPDLPGYITNAEIPYWDGWFGIKYDPTITRAVYPKMISDTEGEEFYTYALWDVTNQMLVSSLENIYVDWVWDSVVSPKIIWADDGSRFAFVGHNVNSQPIFELYEVSRDGQIDQLTNLFSIGHFRDIPFSWSPDGRRIVMLVDIHPDIEVYNVFVLDLETKNITNTCISVKLDMTAEDYLPVWSPDGQQFLVKDWLDDTQSRIILVDTSQNFAAQIAENKKLIGWMIELED